MTTQRVPLEIFEETYCKLLSLLEKMALDLGLVIEGEITSFRVNDHSVRIETEILADDGTWERSNIYEKRFTYPSSGASN